MPSEPQSAHLGSLEVCGADGPGRPKRGRRGCVLAGHVWLRVHARLGRPEAWRCLGHCAVLLLIVAGVWDAYWPSLRHTTGADHFDYLINVFGQHTTWDIFAHTYSYNRTRVVGPGDTMCFRPLFFLWLAWQQAWHEANLSAWQATGVWLHCGVCYLLFRILRLATRASGRDSLGKFLLAATATLFFALSPSVAVMVVWTHVNAYMVFLIVTLGAVELLLRQALDRDATRRWSVVRLGAAWLLMCAATFTYELGQFVAVLAGLLVLHMGVARGRKDAGLLGLTAFASIALLYQGMNGLDQAAHVGQYTPDLDLPLIVRRALSWDCLEHAGRLAAYSLAQPLFPENLQMDALARVEIRELRWSQLRFDLWTLAGVAVAGVWFALCVLRVRRPVKNQVRGLTAGAVLVTAVLAMYLGIIVCGRMNVRPGPEILQRNSYYAYTPLLLLVVATGLWWSSRELRGGKILGIVLGVPLLALAFYGGTLTKRMNEIYAEHHPARERVDEIQRLVETHRHMPGFGLAFDCDDETRQKGVPFLSALFHRYEDNHRPSHVVVWRRGDLAILAREEYLRQYPHEHTQLFPDLVKIGAEFHIYHYAGKYQAVIYDDGRWRLAPEADSLERAEAEAWKELSPAEDEGVREPDGTRAGQEDTRGAP